MAKNNHQITNIESRLDKLFSEQYFDHEKPEGNTLETFLQVAALYAHVENAIAVLSDLKIKKSYLFYGSLGEDLGIEEEGTSKVLDTIWEEEILSRIVPDDLNQKQADELVFFSFAKKEERAEDYTLSSHLRMVDDKGVIHPVKHRISYFKDDNTLRYALCLYNASEATHPTSILDSRTGKEMLLSKIGGASIILSEREIEVLSLISRGFSSKEIAKALAISIHTVSRHRQNIIEEMNVKNSAEACKMASLIGII